MKKISIVIPFYNEEEVINHTYNEITKYINQLENQYNFEIVCVNDGSKDKTLKLLLELAEKDSRLKIIDLSRNFGHEMAILAGLENSTGDAVITMDCDLQDPPSLIPKMLKLWEEGYEIIHAKRNKREKDSFFKKISAKLFYKIFNRLSSTQMPENVANFRLLDRNALDALLRFREHKRYYRGLSILIGFKQTFIEHERNKRVAGETKYPLKKMIRLATDAILAFSSIPLQIITQIGILISFVSFLGIVYALIVKLFFPEYAVPGWAFTTIAIFFLGGIQILIMSIIGMYIERIYTEVLNRPHYIIRAIYENKK